MTSPYRAEPPPIARYVLRTNPRFTSQLRGALAISALLLAIAGTYWSGAKRDPAAWILVGLAVAVPLCTFVFGSGHFIGGGAGTLTIYRDRIEAPRAFGRRPLRLPIAAVEVVLRKDASRGPRGVIITHIAGLSIKAPGVSRTLAWGVFESSELVARAADDIERVRRGLDPNEPNDATLGATPNVTDAASVTTLAAPPKPSASSDGPGRPPSEHRSRS